MNKQQLANRIWASANKMRSKIDANEYKDFILGLIFYKYLCDKESDYLCQKKKFEEADLDTLPTFDDALDDSMDKDVVVSLQKNIGYYIASPYLFGNWIKTNSSFEVATLSAALGNFERSIPQKTDASGNPTSPYSRIFDTLRANLSKLGDTRSQTNSSAPDLIYKSHSRFFGQQ